ncbi:MAG: DUF2442 domain-containing protein [Planctomycetes bacterium]|nr:DUF2442 domain-containing protein [Planctomycetota bacterium]
MPVTRPVTARRIETSDKHLALVLSDREVRIPWARCSPLLAAATPQQRRQAVLSPGGYGIHWPLLDEDLSVEGLLRQVDRDQT